MSSFNKPKLEFPEEMAIDVLRIDKMPTIEEKDIPENEQEGEEEKKPESTDKLRINTKVTGKWDSGKAQSPFFGNTAKNKKDSFFKKVEENSDGISLDQVSDSFDESEFETKLARRYAKKEKSLKLSEVSDKDNPPPESPYVKLSDTPPLRLSNHL